MTQAIERAIPASKALTFFYPNARIEKVFHTYSSTHIIYSLETRFGVSSRFLFSVSSEGVPHNSALTPEMEKHLLVALGMN